MFFFEARVISVHTWLFPGQSSPFPTKDAAPRLGGSTVREAGGAETGPVFQQEQHRPPTQWTGASARSLPPGTQFESSPPTLLAPNSPLGCSGTLAHEMSGGRDESSDLPTCVTSPPPWKAAPSQPIPHPENTCRTRWARRDSWGLPCPPARFSAAGQGAWAPGQPLKAPILPPLPTPRGRRATPAVHRPRYSVGWGIGKSRAHEGAEGRKVQWA